MLSAWDINRYGVEKFKGGGGCKKWCVCFSPEKSNLHLSYFAEFVCCEVLDSNSCFCS